MDEKATTPKLRFETRRPPSALKTDDGRAPFPETDELNRDAHERQKQAVRRDYAQAAQHAEPISASFEDPMPPSSARPQFDEPHPLPVMDEPHPLPVMDGSDGRAAFSTTDEPNESDYERQKRALRRDYMQAQIAKTAPDARENVDNGENIASHVDSATDELAESAHERQKRALRKDYVQAKQAAAVSPGAGEKEGNGENLAPAVERKTGRLRFEDEQPRSPTLRYEKSAPVVERPKAGNDEARIKAPKNGSTSAQGKPPQSGKPGAADGTASPGKLRFEKDRPKKPSALRQTASAAVREAFREHASADLDDNVGLDAANAGERTAGSLARSTRNHAIQKRAIRKGYALAKSGRDSAFATSAAQEAVYTPAERAARRLASFVPQMRGKAMILLLALMLFFMMNSLSSCAPLVEAGLQAIVMGTYPAEEADILAVENAYCAMEDALADELDNYGMLHPEYATVEVSRMDIWHDPYVLIALVCARFDGGEWTIADAYPYLEQLFHAQYEVTVEVNAGVAYVTMTNKNLSHLPFHVLSHAQVGIYALYMSTLGNMPDLFAGNPHASVLKEPMLYDVPEETLAADPNFAALIEEAEKYIGYPYVWGGSEPDTSFDCSGFISWIFTETGVCNIGRLGATGLYNACEEIQPEEARPGDLIFFTGTLGEGEDGNDGITHVGLYVGDGMILHCGDPISYADLSRTYWQEHFYGFGRLY